MRGRYERGRTCEPLDTRPELYNDLMPVWDAFWILNNTRETGFSGASGVRISEIQAWLAMFPVDDSQEFIHLIYSLDREYLSYLNKREQDSKKDGNKH